MTDDTQENQKPIDEQSGVLIEGHIKIFDPDKSIPSPIIFLNSDFTISPDEKSLSIPSEEVLDIKVE